MSEETKETTVGKRLRELASVADAGKLSKEDLSELSAIASSKPAPPEGTVTRQQFNAMNPQERHDFVVTKHGRIVDAAEGK